MRYPSAKSTVFGILIWGVIFILLISFIIIPPEYKLLTFVCSIIGIGFMLWIWFGTYYEFKETYLLG
jgi:hypothetical protein